MAKDCGPAAGLDNHLRVGVDLVPLLPGGDNGGAKLLALELVKYLSRLAPNWEFVLFTSEKCHDELAALDTTNVRRLCVLRPESAPVSPVSRANRVGKWIGGKLDRFFPLRARAMLDYSFRRAACQLGHGSFPAETGIDLLFCPFTASFFHHPSVPMVSIIYDLQYHYYPQFFSPEDRRCREKNFMEACHLADRLVCISEYVRGTVLENSDLDPDKVCSIHIQLPNRVREPSTSFIHSVLQRFGLRENEFFLYPANFWEHKNHRMLFTALGMYHSSNPGSNLPLVCTGALEKERLALQEAADRMGLGERIVLPGFIADDEFAALMASCLALVFPSLFEGFGMPVLEAMAFGKPVICSNVTSLPEVAGEAALYIDPRNPRDMAKAMERMATEEGLRKGLVELGRQRLARFGGPEKMALEYLEVFQDAMNGPGAAPHVLRGIYPDGWTADRMVFKYGKQAGARHFEAVFHSPPSLPHNVLSITVSDGNGRSKTRPIKKGGTATLRFEMSDRGGIVLLQFEPTFQPKACGMNEDDRLLGCMCREFRVVSEKGPVDLLREIIIGDRRAG